MSPRKVGSVSCHGTAFFHEQVISSFIANFLLHPGLIRSLGRVKKEMRLTRYFTYMLVSIVKIVAFVISALLILHTKGENVGHLFTKLPSAFSNHKLNVTPIKLSATGVAPDLTEILIAGGDATETINADISTPIYVLLLQIFGAYFAYVFGERIVIITTSLFQRHVKFAMNFHWKQKSISSPTAF